MNSRISVSRRKKSTRMTLAAVLFASVFLASGALAPAMGATPPLNNVQVFVKTASDLQYTYYFSAYNLSGSLVASSESPYPGTGFELPDGGYLFTVSAIGQQNIYCELCAQPLATGAATPGNSSGSVTGIPIKYLQPSSEYGFRVEQVAGPDSFTIATQNVTGFPTTRVTVSVTYVNGTAAAGASVSASVVGQWYSWWGPDSRVDMYNQTNSSGLATLVIPSAPAVVSAWKWVPIELPMNQKSEMVNVGGEIVNVTAYWEPTYVGLAASGLVLPPDTAIKLTLHYQPLDYWAVPAVGRVAPSAGGAVSSTPSAAPTETQQGTSSQYFLPSTIPAAESVAGANNTPSAPVEAGWTPALVAAIVVSAIAAVAVGTASVVWLRRRSSK
jgi:hypothetical protein